MANLEQELKQFDEANGDFWVDETKTWVYFETGAIRELSAYGVIQPPPTDPYKKAERVVFFFTKKLELAVSEFSYTKRQLISGAKMNLAQRSPAFPDKQGPKVLKELQSKVKSYQRKLSEAKETLEKSKPQELIDRENANSKARSETAELIGELDKIEV